MGGWVWGFRLGVVGAGQLFPELLDQEPGMFGDVVEVALVVEVVGAVEIVEADLLVAQPLDAQSDLLAAEVAGEGFGGVDDGRPDAVRQSFGGPDVQAVELRAVRVVLVHLRGHHLEVVDLQDQD
jgi:hypothetical protein